MQPILAIILMTFLASGSAVAQTTIPPKGCDQLVDVAKIASSDTPLVMRTNQSLCLDSQQIKTWFVDQGGWGSALTDDNRYWHLTPPGSTQAVFTLHLPSGDQSKLEVVVNSAKDEDAEASFN